MELCACGRPLHYSDPAVEAFVAGVIRERGPNIVATIAGQPWEIPRHYIALHGLDDVDPEALNLTRAITSPSRAADNGASRRRRGAHDPSAQL